MKSHARVVVIGGGVVGCGVLYHLVKMGWSDVALVEKTDLTEEQMDELLDPVKMTEPGLGGGAGGG